MNHQVLTWGNGKESNCNMAPIDSSAPAETSKWGPVSPKRLQSSNFDLVRSSRAVPPQWMVNRSGELNSGESSLTAVNTRWNGICTNDVWSGDTENTQGEAITSSSKQHSNTGFSSGGSSKHFKESCYAVDVPVGDIAINGNKEGCNPNGVPNEMVPWLQYPLDASLEQNYCTDFFGQLPSLSTANIQDLRDSFTGGHAQQQMQQQPHHRGPSRFMRNQFPHYDYLQRIATADAALAQGAGRVAGLLPTRAGVEAFTKVRTCLQQPDAVQGRYSPTSSSNCGKADVEISAPVTASLSAEGMPSSEGRRTPGGVSSVAACGSTSTSERRQQQQAATFPPPLLQTPAPESIALPQAQTPAVALVSPVNFPQFSITSVEKKHVADVARREAATKSTKVSCSTPAQRSAVPPPVGSKDIRFGLSSPAGVSSSKAESTPMNLRDVSERKIPNELEQKSEGELHGVRSAQDKSMWPAVVQNSRLLDSGNSGSVDPFRSNATAAKAHPLDRDGPLRSGVTACETRGLDAPTPIGNASIGNASIGNAERRGGSDLQSYLEPTFTPAGPPDKAKKTTAKGKRRAKDESDSQMDESEDGSPSDDLRRTQSRGREVKRTRAAEVHNLSERRRRDRINEKMRALQELIPNSNKADKASMLDEAIEYLKMLQVQLQMMSMRNGMGIPSMIPTNMQHMQMGAMPPWGMGLGMGMGIGVGMGAGMGVGMGTSMGPGMGTSMGAGMGPGMGAGMGPGMGAGMGPGMGAAGLGAGMGAGMGASMGAGMGMGVGMGVGMGMTPMMIGPGTEIKRVNHTGAAGHQPLNLVSRQPDGSQQVGGPLFPPLASPYYHSTSFPR